MDSLQLLNSPGLSTHKTTSNVGGYSSYDFDFKNQYIQESGYQLVHGQLTYYWLQHQREKKNDGSSSPLLQKPLTAKFPMPTPMQATRVELGGSFFKKRAKGHEKRGLC